MNVNVKIGCSSACCPNEIFKDDISEQLTQTLTFQTHDFKTLRKIEALLFLKLQFRKYGTEMPISNSI